MTADKVTVDKLAGRGIMGVNEKGALGVPL